MPQSESPVPSGLTVVIGTSALAEAKLPLRSKARTPVDPPPAGPTATTTRPSTPMAGADARPSIPTGQPASSPSGPTAVMRLSWGLPQWNSCHRQSRRERPPSHSSTRVARRRLGGSCRRPPRSAPRLLGRRHSAHRRASARHRPSDHRTAGRTPERPAIRRASGRLPRSRGRSHPGAAQSQAVSQTTRTEPSSTGNS